MNPCTIASPVEDLDGDDRWLSIHRRFLSECREKDPDVIFLGDCVLESLQHTETWNLYFAPMHCLNFSIRNDRTQNVLWRVENGELDNVRPKVGSFVLCSRRWICSKCFRLDSSTACWHEQHWEHCWGNSRGNLRDCAEDTGETPRGLHCASGEYWFLGLEGNLYANWILGQVSKYITAKF